MYALCSIIIVNDNNNNNDNNKLTPKDVLFLSFSMLCTLGCRTYQHD